MRFTYIVVGYRASENCTWNGCKHTYEDEADLSMDLVNLHDLYHVGERPELQAGCAEEENRDRECNQKVHRVRE